MKPKAITIYGPPGAGKGTQANLLAWKRGFFHLDTFLKPKALMI